MVGPPFRSLGVLVPALGLLGTPAPDRAAPDPVSTAPAASASATVAEAGAEAQSCQFAIRAKNNMSFDVWVELYDSTVRLDSPFVPALLRNNKQLKIQNHRIATGKTMDRRYEASGDCGTRRQWVIYVRIGGREAREAVQRTTQGTEWGDRIVDLGNSSTWGL